MILIWELFRFVVAWLRVFGLVTHYWALHQRAHDAISACGASCEKRSYLHRGEEYYFCCLQFLIVFPLLIYSFSFYADREYDTKPGDRQRGTWPVQGSYFVIFFSLRYTMSTKTSGRPTLLSTSKWGLGFSLFCLLYYDCWCQASDLRTRTAAYCTFQTYPRRCFYIVRIATVPMYR